MKYINHVKEYQPKLDLIETEVAIKFVKDNFEMELAKALNLTRVSAPLFVLPQTGLNDHLNGYERVVKFDILDLKEDVEIVQSLAKWKRNALRKYQFELGKGLYTDMNAIRRDEELDAIHSVYVDQWDWEKIIDRKDRNIEYLKETVQKIYSVIQRISKRVNKAFPSIQVKLPTDITFMSTEELERYYPDKTRKERENLICEKYGAVFLYHIGWPLQDGKPHDGRAADYDDWNYNGDILVWNPILQIAFELSSMGIRVDQESLPKQLEYKNELSKLNNEYCQNIMKNHLPLTIGGGIGQSRLCMFMLEKAHIGEVQVSVWDETYVKILSKKNIHLL